MLNRAYWAGPAVAVMAVYLSVAGMADPSSSVVQTTARPGLAPTSPPPRQLNGSLSDLAAQFEKTPDTVVADVNGVPITTGMIADHMRNLSPNVAGLPAATIYDRSLDDVVQQRALALKARELGIDKTPAIRRRIDEAIDHELANALILHIVPEMVTEQAIKDRYAAAIAGKPGLVEVQFRVIATPDEATAELALAALRNGTDFAGAARQFSIDATKMQGGEAGYASRQQLTPEIGAVAFALAPGQMSQFPIASQGRWFIIQVEGRRQKATPTLDESRAALAAQLTREAALQIIQKTRAAVVVNDYGPSGMRAGATPGRASVK